MAIRFKFAKIADNISEEDALSVDKEGNKKARVRPVLLSDKTLGHRELAEKIAKQYSRHSMEAYSMVEMVLDAIKDTLKEGNIVHIEDFGSFSVNAQFRKNTLGNLDESSRGNSLEVKNVVFKADKKLKQNINSAGFEKFNPEKHGTRRKY